MSRIRPPASVYLAALVRRFDDDLLEPVGSASSQSGLGAKDDGELVPPLLDEGP